MVARTYRPVTDRSRLRSKHPRHWGPSRRPPSGTESRWEPVTTAFFGETATDDAGPRGEGPGTSQSQPALRREVRPLPLDAGAEQPRQRAMPRGQRPGGQLVHVHRPHRVRRVIPGHPMHRPYALVLLAQVGQRNQHPGNARTPSAARPRSPPGSASPDRPGSHHPAAAATRRHGPASAPPRSRTAAARTATACGHAWPQPVRRRRPAPSSAA